MPLLSWSAGRPDCDAICESWLELRTCSTWAGVIAWLAPLPIHDWATPPRPFASILPTSWCRPV